MMAQIEPPTIPQGDGKRRLLLLVGLLCAPLVVVVMGFLIFRVSNASEIRRLEAKIMAAGEPLTFEDLAATYAAIPDEVNGALPLMEVWAKDDPDFWDAFRAGSNSLFRSRGRPLDEALSFLGPFVTDIPRSGELPQTNRLAAENYLADRAEHLDQIRIALQHRQFRFPLKFDRGPRMLIPHLAELKAEAQNFRIVALLATERSDIQGALEAMENMARAGAVSADEPCLISQLVRIACYANTLQSMERVLTRRTLNAEQLDRLAHLVEQMEMRGVFRKTLIAERVFMLAAFETPGDYFHSASDGDDASSPPKPAPIVGILNVTGLAAVDRRLLLTSMNKVIALADREDADSLVQCAQVLLDAEAKAQRFPPKLLTRMLMASMQKVGWRFARLEAHRRLALIAIGMERFRLAHNGLLPDALDELVPEFLPQLPKDPFNDEPIQYKRLAVGYELYSVGENRVDDGGKERTKRALPGDYDETFFVER